MSTSANKQFIEVPEPLFKYSGEKIIHEDNLSILSLVDENAILSTKEYRKTRSLLQEIETDLDKLQANQLLADYETMNQAINSLKLEMNLLRGYGQELERGYADTFKTDRYDYLLVLIAWVANKIWYRLNCEQKPSLAKLKTERQALVEILAPMRGAIILRNQLKQKIISHLAAVEDKKKEALLQKGMAQEALIISNQISMSLARMGFKTTVTIVRNNKIVKTKVHRVWFDLAIATPDQIQLKLQASKQGLFGGSIDMLPEGVYASDILQEKVLNELSITLEREVWSPHTADEKASVVNGAWIFVERLGLVEGIPVNVTYKQLMARYETAEHAKLPIPARLKKGRRINWVYLNSHEGIHLMFNGISNSGKSNAMRAMIAALIEKQSPKDVVFVFIDLKKMGDFKEFGDAPHCLSLDGKTVIKEIGDIVEMLQRVRDEMHMRQAVIGEVATNILDYNRRVQEKDRFPKIIVVFDEFANTRRGRFDDDADVIDDICVEIGQVGRATGISLWIGIQQPRRDNMPQNLRDNLATSFIGHQANIGASQSVSGNRDAVKLEDYPGRMLAKVGSKEYKIQMPFITEEEVQRAVDIGRAAYGNIAPYELTYNESMAKMSGSEVKEARRLAPKEMILKIAFEQFDGALKATRIWEHDKSITSLNKVKSICKELAVQDAITWQGIDYKAVKVAGNNYYVLKELGYTESDIQADVLDGVSEMAHESL